MPKGFRDNAYLFTTSQFALTRAIDLFPLTPGLLTKIALVSCDPSDYQGNLDVSYLLSRLTTGASTAKPCAIVLYSKQAQHCNLTNQGDYDKVFTVKGSKDSEDLLRGALRSSSKLSTRSAHASSIRPDPSSDVGKGAIDPETGMLGAPGSFVGDDGGGSPGGGAGGDKSGGGSSNALIILYTITAIVTILFLAVIVAGAVRAHRNPARYGPRAGAPNGRTRQTRAKGLARAMLETLPVVKFGDDEEWQERDVDHAKKDVEMADYDEGTRKSGNLHQREDVDDKIREKATDHKTDRKEPRTTEDDISMSSGQIKPVIADQSALSKEISTGNDEHDHEDNHETSQITLDSRNQTTSLKTRHSSVRSAQMTSRRARTSVFYHAAIASTPTASIRGWSM
ncbi:hypothetical protein KEM56_006601 [Ascosphaera pollenicola]|nr:hypothetical protein KEM56_006601 [Ascosphaera pollenicola]